MDRTLHLPEDPVGQLAISQDHRRRIVRAFRAWTADAVVADDLTQETLLEAWRSPRRPTQDPDLTRWLFGVARNVLLRHRRDQVRHGRWHQDLPDDDSAFALASQTFDLDTDLERDDIVALLDAALSRVPAESRRALLMRYIEDLPQAEIAQRLDLNEKALEGKLHRGKRAMHRFLVTDGSERARSLGLIDTENEWLITNLWCDICGRQRLLGRWRDDGGLHLVCPSCAPINGRRMCHTDVDGEITAGLRSFGSAYGRLSRHYHQWSKHGFDHFRTCPNCGGRVEVDRHDDEWPSYPEYWLRCASCPSVQYWSPFGSTMSHPAFRSWMKRERRVAVDPSPPIIDRDGQVALHLRWKSLTSSSTYEALRDRMTQRCLLVAIDGQPLRTEEPGAPQDWAS
jgi:RNA polymerase sigma-70 factor (ECF subfamily)